MKDAIANWRATELSSPNCLRIFRKLKGSRQMSRVWLGIVDVNVLYHAHNSSHLRRGYPIIRNAISYGTTGPCAFGGYRSENVLNQLASRLRLSSADAPEVQSSDVVKADDLSLHAELQFRLASGTISWVGFLITALWVENKLNGPAKKPQSGEGTFAGHIFVGRIFAGKLQRNRKQIQRVHRHPTRTVRLLDIAAGGQRSTAIEDANIVEPA